MANGDSLRARIISLLLRSGRIKIWGMGYEVRSLEISLVGIGEIVDSNYTQVYESKGGLTDGSD
jgi:hypothetical protein